MHGHWRAFLGPAILFFAAAGCGPSAPTAISTNVPEPVVLKVSGSGTVTTLLSAIELAFEADTPGYRLEILPGTGTGGGVEGIVKGVLDVAAMARKAKDTETAQGIQYVEFGQSPIVIFAHPDLAVTSLTTEQVKAIFAGEVLNWSQLGAADQPLVVYVRDEGDSSTQVLRTAIWGDTAFPATAAVLTSQQDMQAAIAATPGSVGFGSLTSALATGAGIKALALDGVAPDDPSYPHLAPLGIGYLADRETAVQPLVTWLLSARGRAALQEYGAIVSP